MTDPVYPTARLQLHKDSWGTAMAELKGTKQTLTVDPCIRMTLIYPLTRNRGPLAKFSAY